MLRTNDSERRASRTALVAATLMIVAIAIAGCARPDYNAGIDLKNIKPDGKGESAKARPSKTKETGGDTGSSTKVSPASASTPSAVPSEPSMISDVEGSLEAFRGKVVILDVWATWCPPCRMEIPGFIRLQEKYRDQGLEIIGLSVDPLMPRGGGAAAVAPFMKQFGINYTIWMLNNPNGFGKYPMGQGIPTTYVIDRDGRTSKMYVGMRPESQFESDVKELL